MRNLLTFMIFRNVWLWFHVLAGGAGAKMFMGYFSLQPNHAVFAVFMGALLWEIFEYNLQNIEAVYGSKGAFLLDAVGDVLGALLMAIIVVL